MSRKDTNEAVVNLIERYAAGDVSDTDGTKQLFQIARESMEEIPCEPDVDENDCRD